MFNIDIIRLRNSIGIAFICTLFLASFFVLIPDPSFNEYTKQDISEKRTNEVQRNSTSDKTSNSPSKQTKIEIDGDKVSLDIKSSSRDFTHEVVAKTIDSIGKTTLLNSIKNNKLRDTTNNAASATVKKEVAKKEPKDEIKEEEEEKVKKKNLIFNSIIGEFSIPLWFTLTFLIYLIYGRPEFKDYFPSASREKESGIHAKLNYQVIADRQTRKLTFLMIFIIAFSVIFIFTVFRFSSEIDKIIHTDDIIAYDSWITTLEKHIGNNENFIEENTKMFWTVYFVRFILVRSLIAFIVAALITFLIKLYNQTRQDRDLIIQKEEALSALHYIARGEWRFDYDKEANALYQGDSFVNNKVITEKAYLLLSEYLKKHYKPKELDYLDSSIESDARLTTKELLDLIPIPELFRTSFSPKTKSKKQDQEIAIETNQAKESLKDFINELQKSTTVIRNFNDLDPKKGNPK